MFKKRYLLILALLITFTSFVSYTYEESIEAYKNLVNLKVNGLIVGNAGDDYSLSDGSKTPFTLSYKGTTYLPVPKISELLEIDVNWDQATNTVILGEDRSINNSVKDATLDLESRALPSSINMISVEGATFSMGSDSLKGSPKQRESALVHDVTLTSYSMSESEVTNEQYAEFLNLAYKEGLIEITIGQNGASKANRYIQGSDKSSYAGKALYNLDGSRVLKDHDNEDGDNDPFTGSVEAENPLNTAYIDFDENLQLFFVKDPLNPDDFNWYEMCNYSNYTSIKRELEATILNDFEDWSGSGELLSSELMGWTIENPEAATNLVKLGEVKKWPVTFIQWWGAYAFADFYCASLPTEAQWEYAAKTDQNFEYAVYDGIDISDANWNQLSEKVATHHVREAISGQANPFGFYNLGGNAWEWMLDNYVDDYDTSNNIDPVVEIVASTTRSWRGGSWNYHEATLQSSVRFSDDETHGNDHFGFRIVFNK